LGLQPLRQDPARKVRHGLIPVQRGLFQTLVQLSGQIDREPDAGFPIGSSWSSGLGGLARVRSRWVGPPIASPGRGGAGRDFIGEKAQADPFAPQTHPRAALAVPLELAGDVRHPALSIDRHF
jgi:hypothetical protein